MSRHADAILAAIEMGDATSRIATSWRRCTGVHRLDPDAVVVPERDSRALRDAEERDAALIAAAGPHLERLFVALADPLGVMLVDRDGLMLAMRTGRTQEADERRFSRWLGSNVSEAAIGTNGNGTCLTEERAVIVSGDDHFLSMLTQTICCGAPIFGADGRLIGCLNVTVHAADTHHGRIEPLLLAVVRDIAQRIEVELFATAFPAARVMLASEFGRNPDALIAVDRDGIVIGATRGARRLFEVTDERIAAGLELEALRGGTPDGTLAAAERRTIALALARHDGNVSRAARSLGISRSTFYRKATGLLPRGAA